MTEKFPASADTVPEVLARIRREAKALKSQATGWRSEMSGSIDVESLSSMIEVLKNIDDTFGDAVDLYGLPTLGQVAQTYLGVDPTGAFANMREKLDAARVAIRDAIPKHNGAPLEFIMDADTGEKTPVILSSADTTAAQAALTAFIDSID